MWKKVVWTGRRAQVFSKDLGKFARSTLIIGTICGKPNKVIGGLPLPDHIEYKHLLKRLPRYGGGLAVQYAFNDDQGVDFIRAHGFDKISCHKFTQRDRDQLDREFAEISQA